ncbi:HEPN domain-containing protein [Candidatus Woesearchaeota archaeon]|nr:HEPN domain-containing protein [Candidatus Woesearchaeota archaeon]
MDWTECKKKGFVKNIKLDLNLISALEKQSKNKLISSKMIELNETTTSSKVSLAYDSLRKLLEALAIKKGFKIYNHECYCSFLKEIIKDSLLGSHFDDLRIIRNKINYYGEDLSIEEAKQILKEIEEILNKVSKL